MFSIIVMYIWASSGYGGPAIITGFKNIDHCKASEQTVKEEFMLVLKDRRLTGRTVDT